MGEYFTWSVGQRPHAEAFQVENECGLRHEGSRQVVFLLVFS